MAKRKKGNKNTISDAEKILNIQKIDQYGISPELINKLDEEISDVKKVVNDKIMTRALKANKSVKSNSAIPNIAYLDLIGSTMTDTEILDINMEVKRNKNLHSSRSGAYNIDSSNSHEMQMIDELLYDVNGHFETMTEYPKILQMIPMLQKVIDVIVTDVTQGNEMDSKFIKNFYRVKNNPEESSKIETILSDILEEYGFEERLRKWITTSEVCGCQPVSILPIEDVIDFIKDGVDNKNGAITQESVDEYVRSNKQTILDSCISHSPISKLYNKDVKSLEDADVNIYNASINNFTSDIINNELRDEWKKCSLESLEEQLNISIDEDFIKGDENVIVRNKDIFKNIVENVEKDNGTGIIDAHISDLIKDIDQRITVIDPKKTALFAGVSRIKDNKFKKSSSDSKSFADELKNDNYYDIGNKKSKKKKKDNSKIMKFDEFNIVFDGSSISGADFANKSNNIRPIVTVHNPEDVLPITEGGEHIGYFVIERTNVGYNTAYNRNIKSNTFADIIKSVGYNNDGELSADNGGLDVSNVYSDGALGFSNIISRRNPMYEEASDHDISGVDMRKLNILKKIMTRTIAKRLGDVSLADNATFQNSLINILRQENIMRKNIQFSFIPASHMVYFNRELNDKGFAVSIFDGCLLDLYSHIASKFSSLMIKLAKAADKEILRINVGKSKDMGLSIASVLQNSSIRNRSASGLFGGVTQLMRNAVGYQKHVIPITKDGSPLYDIENMDRINDIDIDDEFTDRCLKNVIMKIGVAPTTADMLSEDEYVASQTQHRLDYRNMIMRKLNRYSRQITKFIQLVSYYTDIGGVVDENGIISMKSKSNDNDNSLELDISNIDFKPPPPKTLMVNRINDELSNISDSVETLIESYLGDEDRESEEYPIFVQTLKKNLTKELANFPNWPRIDEIIEESKRQSIKGYAKASIDNTPTADGGDDGGGGSNW